MIHIPIMHMLKNLFLISETGKAFFLSIYEYDMKFGSLCKAKMILHIMIYCADNVMQQTCCTMSHLDSALLPIWGINCLLWPSNDVYQKCSVCVALNN